MRFDDLRDRVLARCDAVFDEIFDDGPGCDTVYLIEELHATAVELVDAAEGQAANVVEAANDARNFLAAAVEAYAAGGARMSMKEWREVQGLVQEAQEALETAKVAA